jgi:hypothetical protein
MIHDSISDIHHGCWDKIVTNAVFCIWYVQEKGIISVTTDVREFCSGGYETIESIIICRLVHYGISSFQGGVIGPMASNVQEISNYSNLGYNRAASSSVTI